MFYVIRVCCLSLWLSFCHVFYFVPYLFLPFLCLSEEFYFIVHFYNYDNSFSLRFLCLALFLFLFASLLFSHFYSAFFNASFFILLPSVFLLLWLFYVFSSLLVFVIPSLLLFLLFCTLIPCVLICFLQSYIFFMLYCWALFFLETRDVICKAILWRAVIF